VHTHNESQEKLAHIRFTYIKPTKILLKSYVVILSRFSAAGSERFLPAVQFRRDTSDQEGPFSHSAILPEGVEQDSATIRRSSVNEIRYKRTSHEAGYTKYSEKGYNESCMGNTVDYIHLFNNIVIECTRKI